MTKDDAIKNLNELATTCHLENHRWWRDPTTFQRLNRNKGELLMLMVSELAEAMEGERKDKADEHLPEFKSVEVELADCLIRIFDYCGAFQLRLGEAFMAKLNYNRTRHDHSYEARSAAGGKKF